MSARKNTRRSEQQVHTDICLVASFSSLYIFLLLQGILRGGREGCNQLLTLPFHVYTSVCYNYAYVCVCMYV